MFLCFLKHATCWESTSMRNSRICLSEWGLWPTSLQTESPTQPGATSFLRRETLFLPNKSSGSSGTRRLPNVTSVGCGSEVFLSQLQGLSIHSLPSQVAVSPVVPQLTRGEQMSSFHPAPSVVCLALSRSLARTRGRLSAVPGPASTQGTQSRWQGDAAGRRFVATPNIVTLLITFCVCRKIIGFLNKNISSLHTMGLLLLYVDKVINILEFLRFYCHDGKLWESWPTQRKALWGPW